MAYVPKTDWKNKGEPGAVPVYAEDAIRWELGIAQASSDAEGAMAEINGRLSESNLNARLGLDTAVDMFPARLEFGQDLAVGIAADSTGNDVNDWAVLWGRLVASSYPDLRVVSKQWNATTEAYADVELQTGSTSGPGGVVFSDDFTTIGDISGSTPQVGSPWTGAPAVWYSDGATAAPSSTGPIVATTPQKDATTTVDLIVTTTGTGALQSLSVYIGSGTNLWVVVAINATGLCSVSLWHHNGTASAVLVASQYPLDTNSPTPQALTIAVTVDGLDVTLTINGTPHAVVISQDEYDSLVQQIQLWANNPMPGIKVDKVVVTIPEGTAATQTMTIWNGSRAGGTLAYQQERLAALYPDPLDVLIASHGHNYSTTPAVFTAALQEFASAFAAVHPETKMLWSSQNPQFTATSAGHAERQGAARLFAAQQGWAYAPVFETFARQADGGQAWVELDGVHPTGPASPYLPVDGTGSTEWAKVLHGLTTDRPTSV